MKKKRKNTHDAEADVEIKRSGAERLAGAGGTASRWDFKENEDQDDDDDDIYIMMQCLFVCHEK